MDDAASDARSSATAPDWLDELQLSSGPPWLAMGIHAMADASWLLEDADRERDLRLKASLLTERHDEVFVALDTPAVRAASEEVLQIVVDATGDDPAHGWHPLDAAGRLVQEDLCVVVHRDGAPHLDAASVCFPSHWRLADKIGRPLVEVHTPVAHYREELSDRVDRFFARLPPDRPVWRRNWSIHDDPTFFAPDAAPDSQQHADPPGELWLRTERQTLRRLDTPDTSLFAIRTQQVPLAALARRPDVAHRMAAAIDAWSSDLTAYKGGHGAVRATAWLASV